MMRLSVLAFVVVSGLLAACGTDADPVEEGSSLDSQAQMLPANEVHTWYYTSATLHSDQMVGERTQYCDTSKESWGVTTPYFKRFTLSCQTWDDNLECYDCSTFPCKLISCP